MASRKRRERASLLEWRRKEVAEMWFSGKKVDEMAKILQVHPQTIYDDMEYIENNANELMKNYLVKTVPHIINRSLYQIDLANRESMRIMQDANTDKKLKVTAALAVAKTARDVVEILTNNKTIVDMALELQDVGNEKEDELLNEFLSRDSTKAEEPTEDPNRVF